MQIFVVIASAGRPDAVAELADWSSKVAAPAGASLTWLLSTPTLSDAPPHLPESWQLLTGRSGAASQRNLALDHLPATADFVFFFDDDALPRQDYLTATVDHLLTHPHHVATTGRLVRDGAVEKCEVALLEAVAALDRSWADEAPGWQPTRELYGCNFAVRWPMLTQLRFEDRFPLYSWMEDLDYSGQALRLGELAQLGSAVAVHRAVASGGRAQHVRLGYSQIANPALMVENGTLAFRTALVKAGRPALRNLVGVVLPGERSLRIERVKGNWLAIGDLLTAGGHARPERILEL